MINMSVVEVLNQIATREELIFALTQKYGIVSGFREDGVQMLLINPIVKNEEPISPVR